MAMTLSQDAQKVMQASALIWTWRPANLTLDALGAPVSDQPESWRIRVEPDRRGRSSHGPCP